MQKTTKADLSMKVEGNCKDVYTMLPCEDDTVYLIDGMAFLQAVKEEYFHTFDDLARYVLKNIKSVLQANLGVVTVALVFDRYYNMKSIKHSERICS